MAVTHRIRARDRGHVEVELTRAKAIRAQCSECLGWEDHPRTCTDTHCPLFPFRGKSLLAYGRRARAAERPT